MSIFTRYLRRTKLYKKKFSDKEGQELLRFLAIEAGAYTQSFVPGDPYATAFNEGKRHLYSHIIGVMNIDEEVIRKAIIAEEKEIRLQQMILEDELRSSKGA